MCPVGTYTDTESSTSCKACPMQSTTVERGSTSQSDCVAPEYRTCYIFTDPHFRTYDGLLVDFQGICKYTASKTCSAVNPSEEFHFMVKAHKLSTISRVTYIDYLDFYSEDVHWRLLQGKVVEVNGVRTYPPYTIGNTTLTVTSGGIQIQTTSGVRLSFNGGYHASIRLNRRTYEGKVCGICGDCNGNLKNDLVTADGVNLTDSSREANIELGNSWTVPENLTDGVCPPARLDEPFPCQGRMASRVKELNYCGFSTPYTDSPLLECIKSGRVNFPEAVGSCEYDVCEDHLNISISNFQQNPDCLNTGTCQIDYEGSKERACNATMTVVTSCEDAGFSAPGWQSYFGCPLICGENQMYTDVGSSCPNSCPRPNSESTCSTNGTKSGCVCRPGYIFSGAECVLPEECGCEQNEKYYPNGTVWLTDNCTMSNVCTNFSVVFMPTSCPAISSCQQNQCKCDEGAQTLSNSTCLPCTPGTYLRKNMCEMCPVGTYTDTESSTACKACPIQRTTVDKGSSSQSDCVAPGHRTCSIFTDPHFRTYDSKLIDFQGSCRYTASKTISVVDPSEAFNFIVKARTLSEISRVTYIDYLEFLSEGLHWKLLQGKIVEVDGVKTNPPYTIGNTTFISTPGGIQINNSAGVMLTFNGGYHASIRSNRKLYENRVHGICGDCNGNPIDDMVTAEGVILIEDSLEADTILGNSWTVQDNASAEMCPLAESVNPFPCQGRMAYRVKELNYCGFSTPYIDSPLLECIKSGRVNFPEAVDSCEYDVCEDHLNISISNFQQDPDCLNTGTCHIDYERSKERACNATMAAVISCVNAGFSVAGWLPYFRCPSNCSENQIYTDFGSPCPNSCSRRNSESTCWTDFTEAGCVCKKGFFLSGEECVLPGECGCVHERKYYQKYTTWNSLDCSQTFHCGENNTVSGNDSSCPINFRCHLGQCLCDSIGHVLTQDGRCERCKPGTYANIAEDSGKSVCQRCPIGMYSEFQAQATCQPCPNTRTTSSEGSTSSSDCYTPVKTSEILLISISIILGLAAIIVAILLYRAAKRRMKGSSSGTEFSPQTGTNIDWRNVTNSRPENAPTAGSVVSDGYLKPLRTPHHVYEEIIYEELDPPKLPPMRNSTATVGPTATVGVPVSKAKTAPSAEPQYEGPSFSGPENPIHTTRTGDDRKSIHDYLPLKPAESSMSSSTNGKEKKVSSNL